jgi:hypothetical protein
VGCPAEVTTLTYRGDDPVTRPEEDDERFADKAKMRPFVLGYSFGGLRFGIQALGFSRVEQFRFIWEIGAGGW